MRHTAKITLMTGFGVSSIVILILQKTGTGFAPLTASLYLYGFTCLAGGLIGYRRAYLKHVEGKNNPGFLEITGLEVFLKNEEDTTWYVKGEDSTFNADSIRVHGRLVSMELEDGRKLSYPRKSVEKMEKSSS